MENKNTVRPGFNCAQKVFSAFCEKYGVDEATALKIAGGFGGGLRTGEVCGVVSGAVMVIGLKYGQYISDDFTAKKVCYEKTEQFMDKFREINGDVTCRALLGCDIRKDSEYIRENNLFQTKCEVLISSAKALLEELGY